MISIACLFASLCMIRGQLRRPPGTLTVLTFLILLVAGNALRHHMVQGQLNLFLLLLIVGAWLASRNGRDGWSGALLGLAAAVKLFPAFLGLYFLAQRKGRGVWTMALSFMFVNGIAILLFGLGTYVAYFSDVMPSVSRCRDTWQNASVWGFWSRILDGGFGQVVPLWNSPALASFLGIVSSLRVALVTATLIRRSSKSDGQDLAFGLCVVAMLVISPVTWDHYFVLLILPMAIFWSLPGSRLATRLTIATAVVLLLWVDPAWVYRGFIPGYPEASPTPNPAEPIHVITTVAYPFYVLVAAYIAMLRQTHLSSKHVGTSYCT